MTRTFNLVGVLLSLAAPAAACQMAADVPVIRGLVYDDARAVLLAAGWRPGHGSQFDDMTPNQAVFHERGYGELVSCDLSADAACHFVFTGSGGVLLRVVTHGEENVLLDSKARVATAELGCPD